MEIYALSLERRHRNENVLFHRPMYFAKTLKQRFRVSDLDLPERRKMHTCSREEEEVDTQIDVSVWQSNRVELTYNRSRWNLHGGAGRVRRGDGENRRM